MSEVRCVVPAGDWTGEGILWHAAEQALYWVDINRGLTHRYDPATASVRSWMFSEPITTLGLTDRDDTLVATLASRVILWQPANDARADFANPAQDWPAARSNDGASGPSGDFWFGTMQNNVADDGTDKPLFQNLGRVFRVKGDGTFTIERTGIGISNTFVWSPDGRKFYNGDTLANAIHVWDVAADGSIANEQPFFTGFDRGAPDGSCIDAEGYLWNTRYDGGCVVRVSPAGRVDRVLEMPVSAPTNCTFGGPDLKTLYITTAGGGKGSTSGERLAGGLFAVALEVPGIAENRFRIGR